MKNIEGKTIKSFCHMKSKNYNDSGYVKILFTDGYEILLISEYGGYSGGSEGEYPTFLDVIDKEDDEYTKILGNLEQDE